MKSKESTTYLNDYATIGESSDAYTSYTSISNSLNKIETKVESEMNGNRKKVFLLGILTIISISIGVATLVISFNDWNYFDKLKSELILCFDF